MTLTDLPIYAHNFRLGFIYLFVCLLGGLFVCCLLRNAFICDDQDI